MASVPESTTPTRRRAAASAKTASPSGNKSIGRRQKAYTNDIESAAESKQNEELKSETFASPTRKTSSSRRKYEASSQQPEEVNETQREEVAAATPKKKSQTAISVSPSKGDSAKGVSLANRSLSENVVLKHAYAILKKQRGYAYGTPFSPIYGENTQASMQKAFAAMGLGDSKDNVYCDVGSGTGVTCIQAACEYSDLLCYGFELMGSRWWISQNVLLALLKKTETSDAAMRMMFAHLDLTVLPDFGPCTHIFSFDTGFPKAALKAFGAALNASKHARVLGSFQKPNTLIESGFKDLEVLSQIPMRSVGSGEIHSLYVYKITRKAKPLVNRSWDITRLYGHPTESEYQPNVSHSTLYSQGESARLQGRESYLAWVEECLGLGRVSGVQTRSSRRANN